MIRSCKRLQRYCDCLIVAHDALKDACIFCKVMTPYNIAILRNSLKTDGCILPLHPFSSVFSAYNYINVGCMLQDAEPLTSQSI